MPNASQLFSAQLTPQFPTPRLAQWCTSVFPSPDIASRLQQTVIDRDRLVAKCSLALANVGAVPCYLAANQKTH